MTAIRKRLLIADDEQHVRTYLKTLAADLNLDVVGEAANGQEAVAQCRKLAPDLMLMDLNMPIKTGEEALAEIMAEFPATTVVMLSSVADRESVEACMRLGAANYIRKDCSFNEIHDIIRETLERAE
jgi:two-component system chemotaxis response regulator CheY